MFLAGVFQSLRIFIAELHRPNKQAAQDTSIKTRCRVIGYVMFVITLIFGSLVIFASFMHNYIPVEYKNNFVVSTADLFSYQSILTGFIMGIFIYTPIRFLEFSSSEKIKTENYLTVTALSFFSTIFWEWSTSSFTGLSLKEFSEKEFIAGLIITLAALVMSLSKIFLKNNTQDTSKYLKKETQHIEDVLETRDIIANSLEHFNTSVSKSAKALNIPEKVIHQILDDHDKVFAFNEATLKQVARSYRKNIANSDALTGLLNRNGFMSALKTASYESTRLSLFFIDLNKFKPVNDEFGHKAGDLVLKTIADRLRNIFPDKSLITRLGGDEYCILLLNEDKKSAISKINIITQILEKDIIYKNNTINISGSIGLASYPEDTSKPQELIELADKQMYTQKSER
jgi:diguanylate cyclase (GGDEF)-like protein